MSSTHSTLQPDHYLTLPSRTSTERGLVRLSLVANRSPIKRGNVLPFCRVVPITAAEAGYMRVA
jgi:hypothetical protein